VADELFVLCRPGDGVDDVARQAEAVYGALFDALAAEGAGPDAVVNETVFFRRIREEFDVPRAARSRLLGASAGAYRPATTLIGQPPIGDDAELEVAVAAVVPRGSPSSPREVRHAVACSCEACAPGMRARVLRLGEQAWLYAGNVHGSGRDASGEAYDMFRVAERLLAEAGMTFRDVVRTWIHVRDIGRDYDALNGARRQFFLDRRIERRPASTGVQGIPFPETHGFSLSLHAVKSPGRLDATPMSSPSLNEAWTYGADFSRGLRVADANKETLYVSGTASVDETGRTAHAGDIAAQADRMLHNVASLLEPHGATFDDVVSGIAYLKSPSDAPALRAMFRERGFAGFPCALVEAPLCRPEMLCEVEVVGVLPRGA
jgi:enamine deaminase RidA (YjgF/YER057c/UK114 family)